MEFMETIRRRQACRAFQDTQLSGAQLDALLKAANAAPVDMGHYESVHLTVVQNKDLLEKLNVGAAACMGDPSLRPTYDAPTVIIVSCDKAEPEEMNYCSAACVVENLLLTAADMGLGGVYLMGCVRALQDMNDLQAEMNIPDGFMPMAGMAVGVPAGELPARDLTTERIGSDIVR